MNLTNAPARESVYKSTSEKAFYYPCIYLIEFITLDGFIIIRTFVFVNTSHVRRIKKRHGFFTVP